MRKGKALILLLSIILTFLFLFVSTRETVVEKEEIELSFSVVSNGQSERLQSWKSAEGTYYVFLPGYADLSQVFLTENGMQVSIDNKKLNGTESCTAFSLDRPYSFAVEDHGQYCEGNVVFLRSGNMPTLYIDTVSGHMDYLHMDKNNEETGQFRIYDPNGKRIQSGWIEQIKGRGNTSWYAEKKPYNLTLSQAEDLLGMGSGRNWVLLAEGGNELNIRNKIVFDYAKQFGMEYTPDCEWVDLYLNGEYVGLYLLSERNEVHTERINISEENSFVVSMENKGNMEKQKIPYIDVDSLQVLRIRNASMDSGEIKQKWKSLKNALLSENGIDPDTGVHWQDMIDEKSWIRKYLIEEVFANPDGGAVSQYFYMNGSDPEEKIYAGPVWDYDYAMGGEDHWMRHYPSYFTMVREYTQDGMYLPWFYELYRKTEFQSELMKVYEEEFLPLMNWLMDEGLENYHDQIKNAARMNSVRWGYAPENIDREFQSIYDFLKNRITFLSDLWINQTAYHVVCVDKDKYSVGYFAVKDGDVLPDLPSAEDLGGIGWYLVDSDIPYDITQPVREDAHIYMKKPETNLPVIHMVPLAAVIASLTGLAGISIYRDHKNRRKTHDTAKAN